MLILATAKPSVVAIDVKNEDEKVVAKTVTVEKRK